MMKDSIRVPVTVNDFIHVGDFFEELNNILDGIDCQLSTINEYKAEMEAEYRAEMMADMDWDYC